MMSEGRSSPPPVNDYDIKILSVWVLRRVTARIAECIIIKNTDGTQLAAVHYITSASRRGEPRKTRQLSIGTYSEIKIER